MSQAVLALNASRLEANAALECERAGWELRPRGKVWIVTTAGEVIGLGDAPWDAYLSACANAYRSPY